MTDQNDRWSELLESKALQLFLVVLIVVAFIGFFIGTRKGSYEPHSERADEASEVDPERPENEARSYGELLEDPFRSNEQWQGEIERLASERPDLFEEVEVDDEARDDAVADRAENRAYNGAPPTVPHPVKQTGDLACAACHTEGVEVRGRTASPMSHEFRTNCTQCHVSQEVPAPFNQGSTTSGPPLDNAFAGAPSAGEGPRAYEGAPPQIPHSTHMREECASCHGPMGRDGLKTTHPWRQSCQQCHAPSADLEQGLPPGLEYFE